jgi:hypothetical protein
MVLRNIARVEVSMAPSRIIPIVLLGLLLSAGSFLAGYLLMLPATPPPDSPATRVAIPPASVPAATAAARGLVITRAVYGDLPDGASTDVTAKVAALVSHNALSVAASNDNFGDPASGIVKTLRVDYTFDGKPGTRTVDENATLMLQPGPIRLVIKKAVYGDLPGGASADVTAKVAQTAENDSLSIPATNDSFGDPASGIVKKLRVDYTFDGKDKSKTVNENDTLIISSFGD